MVPELLAARHPVFRRSEYSQPPARHVRIAVDLRE
jgi:hypothetical protein